MLYRDRQDVHNLRFLAWFIGMVYWFPSFALGTAGVWRTLAISEAEGWKERTTVEDMDLAVRATLQGWKFVYIGDLKVCVYSSTSS